MNIIILDDYQDAVRKLKCAARLEPYNAKVFTNTVKGTGQLSVRLRDADVAEHIAHTASLTLAPEARPQRRVVIKARKGDSVVTVARRMGVSVSQVAQWNKVGVRAGFKPGQQVVVMLPATTNKTVSRKAVPTRNAKPAPGSRAKPARAK